MASNTPAPLHAHHVHQRHFDRLVMLADGVFAIALTLSAVELKPEAQPGHGLLATWGMPLLVYFFSFAMIGAVWYLHRRAMAQLQRVDLPFTLLTLLLLSLVALVPVVIRVVITGEAGMRPDDGFALYAATLLAIQLCLALAWGYAVFVGKLVQDLPRAQAVAWLLHDLFLCLLWAAAAGWFLHRPWLTGMLAALAVIARVAELRLARPVAGATD